MHLKIAISVVILLLVALLSNNYETYIDIPDYDSLKMKQFELQDKALLANYEKYLLKKNLIADGIRSGAMTQEDVCPKGSIKPNDYPFYDGYPFFNGAPGQRVLTGTKNLSSGGLLEKEKQIKTKKKRVDKPYEIANYLAGTPRTSFGRPASAFF